MISTKDLLCEILPDTRSTLEQDEPSCELFEDPKSSTVLSSREWGKATLLLCHYGIQQFTEHITSK